MNPNGEGRGRNGDRRRSRRGRVLQKAADALEVPRRRSISRSRKTGQTPGTVTFTGSRKVDSTTLDVIRYEGDHLAQVAGAGLDEALAAVEPGGVTWLNVNGLHDTVVLEKIGKRFGLHPLTVEDIASVGQRPKLESFDDYLFIVVRMLSLEGGHLEDEQISMVLSQDTVITFQERPGDILEPLRERIRKGKGRIRGMGADYLAYALLDIVVDHYFVVLEASSAQIDEIEAEVYADPRPEVMERISALKQDALHMRKAVWPVRDLMSALLREESALFTRQTQTFLRDAYDHVVQAIDALETLRETVGSLQDSYLSSLSFRMNEVMQVLTIIATIFIPLTFVAGVYGMNFEYMPELSWRWSYPVLWLLMILMTAGMVWWFRRKNWL